MNNRGQIVGVYTDAQGGRHGFVLEEGVYTPLDVPGATFGTLAYGINDRGQIVGYYNEGTLEGTIHQHGFVRSR